MAIPMGELITPSSVSGSGVSLSGGKVVFTAASSITVNGIFNSTYDNYLLVGLWTALNPVGRNYDWVYLQLASNGTPVTGYTMQQIDVNATSVFGARQTSQNYFWCGYAGNYQPAGSHVYFYGPALAQPTAIRSVTMVSADLAAGSPQIKDIAGTHATATSYNSIVITPPSGNITGSLTVYGFSQ